jgi:hypothetical protein
VSTALSWWPVAVYEARLKEIPSVSSLAAARWIKKGSNAVSVETASAAVHDQGAAEASAAGDETVILRSGDIEDNRTTCDKIPCTCSMLSSMFGLPKEDMQDS